MAVTPDRRHAVLAIAARRTMSPLGGVESFIALRMHRVAPRTPERTFVLCLGNIALRRDGIVSESLVNRCHAYGERLLTDTRW